ncbi:MAG: beta-galactosidase GalB [Bacteroidales bacterium]
MFNKTVIVVLAFLLACLEVIGSPRKIILLDEGWKFLFKDVKDAAGNEFNDTNWKTVAVPHDWAIDKPFNMNIDWQVVQVKADGEEKPQLRTGRTGALPCYGVGWYRKSLFIPVQDKGKNITIEFDGAMSNAQIFINGKFVGEWPFGYASFMFDITKYVEFGKENLLAVRLDNKEESSRWYSGAGLYRNVRLITTNPVHVAHWGTYITTPSIKEKKVEISVKTTINNLSGNITKIALLTEIINSRGEKVAENRCEKVVTEQLVFAQTIKVKNPLLWSIETPAIYKAISKVFVNNQLTDTYETSFGIRTIHFDKEKGFFLNGKHVKIKGVCNHHDLGPLGAAVNYRATERQLEILKDMGCNAIRTSHNPPSPELLDLCDKMGFLVMDESFDEWKIGKNKNGYNTLFDKWAEKDLVAMIRRDRNHPSVIIWSIGNEVLELNSMDPKGKEIARFLTQICHREDPTRPTIAGFNNARGAIDNGIADEVYLFGINYPLIGDMSYAKYHSEKPHYCLLGSETESTVSTRGEYKFPFKEIRSPWPWYFDYQVSSYDCEGPSWASSPDQEFAMQEDCQAVAGQFVWTGFDYLGEPTPYNEGTPARSSYFGIMDLAGLKKDRFYLYQSHWSDKPMLHLLPHWNWPDRVNDTIPVMCYTNYPKAELFVNGKSMGIRVKDKSKTYTRYRLIWENVIYQPGEIKVVAMDNNNNPMAEQVIKTAGEPYQIRLTPDRQSITADGKDLSFITVEVLDKDGNLCPRANILQFFEVKGAGKLKAICNGDPTDQTSFASNYMKTFNGKMVIVVQSTKEAGSISVRSEGSKLKEGIVNITSK